MTVAGIQVINQTSGSVQIDQNYKCWGMSTKSSSSTWSTASYFTSSYHYIDITATATTPMLAISCPDTVYIIATSNTGTSWTWRIISSIVTSSTLSWWVFDTLDHLTITDHFGIEVFDASSNRVFHSSSKPLRVVGAASGSPTSGTFSGIAGHTYGVIHANVYFNEHYYHSGTVYLPVIGGHTYWDWDDTYSASSVSGTTVTYGATFIDTNHGSFAGITAPPDFTKGQDSYVIVDVTNY